MRGIFERNSTWNVGDPFETNNLKEPLRLVRIVLKPTIKPISILLM